MTLHSLTGIAKGPDSYLAFRPSGPASNPVGPAEVSPFVFNDKLYTLTAIAPSGVYSGKLRIDNDLDRPLVTITAPGMSYSVTYVEAGTLHIFGTDPAHGHVSHMTSTDLVTFNAPSVVINTPPGMGFYNTSVTKNTVTGQYVMAVEATDAGYPGIPFICRFMTSPDLVTWTMQLPWIYNNHVFVNCPTLRFNATDGKFYLLYMSISAGVHYTFIARTTDFIIWDNGTGYPDGSTVPFAPSAGEGTNNSDVDLTEYHGKLYFTYCRGDQTSWLETSTAVYNGTLSQYLQSFYP